MHVLNVDVLDFKNNEKVTKSILQHPKYSVRTIDLSN